MKINAVKILRDALKISLAEAEALYGADERLRKVAEYAAVECAAAERRVPRTTLPGKIVDGGYVISEVPVTTVKSGEAIITWK